MKPANPHPQADSTASDAPSLSASQRRTLEAVFRHPSAHNLEWSDLVALIGKIGEVDERANSEFSFHVSGHKYMMRKPHSKDLTGPEVIQVRHFLHEAGWSAAGHAAVAAVAATDAPNLLVVVDHHEAKIYHIEANASDASAREIKPYDPHHFLHHLAHKGESREQGQRAPEDVTFYERIAQTLKGADKIVLIGHGTGKSNAAHLLSDYLRSHAHETAQHIAAELTADLSSTSPPQLLALAETALGAARPAGEIH
jgi:hypothetical protein